MADTYCRDCRHYHDNGSILGLCRRFPTYQNRSPNETCGEFSVKAVAEVTPVDAGAFLRQDVEIKERKRMGRPPKAKEVAE